MKSGIHEESFRKALSLSPLLWVLVDCIIRLSSRFAVSMPSLGLPPEVHRHIMCPAPALRGQL